MGCASSTAVQGSSTSIHERYLFSDKLGQGSFGQVRSCTQLESGRGFAVKILDAPDIRSRAPCNGVNDSAAQRRRDALNEGRLWERIGRHRHVVRLMEIFVDESFTYFVMERCNRSFLDGLKKKKQIPATELLGNFCEMLLGIQHIHKAGVIHRDIKPANFLVGLDGAVKLCDFGLSCLEPKEGCMGVVGTPPFMSPEMLRKEVPYTCMTDIWSFAATAYILLYGKYVYEPPRTQLVTGKYNGVLAMKRAIIWNEPEPNHKPKTGLPMPPVELRHVVKAMLERDSIRRMSATECLSMCQAKLSALEDAEEEAWLAKSQSAAIAATKRVCISSMVEGKSEFQTRPDPTVVKGMDELLEELQSRYRGSPVRAFSSTLGDKSESASRACLSTVSKRSSRRVTTHCGQLSLQMSALGSDDEDITPDNDSSTVASSGDSDAGDPKGFVVFSYEERMEPVDIVSNMPRTHPSRVGH